MGIDDGGVADDVAVPAVKLETVAVPAEVREHDDDLVVANVLKALRIFPRQQQAMGSHDLLDAFVIARCQTF